MEKDIEIKQIKTLSEVLKMRIIRNKCRKYMTLDQAHISLLRQIFWYFTGFNTFNAYLMYRENKAIGYGLINQTKGITLGILPHYRNKGYGTILFKFLIKKGKWLAVLKSNKKAIGLYRRYGFKTYFDEGNTLWMTR